MCEAMGEWAGGSDGEFELWMDKVLRVHRARLMRRFREAVGRELEQKRKALSADWKKFSDGEAVEEERARARREEEIFLSIVEGLRGEAPAGKATDRKQGGKKYV
jgi:hypothetical protein